MQPLLLMKDVTDQTMSWVVRHGEVQVQVLYGYINPAGTLKRMSITPSRREMHVDMQQEVHQQTARLNKQAPTFAAAVQQPSAQQQHAVKLDKCQCPHLCFCRDLIGLLRCTVGQSSLGRVRVVVAEPVVRQGVGVGARGHLTPLQALREVTLHPKVIRNLLLLSCRFEHKASVCEPHSGKVVSEVSMCEYVTRKRQGGLFEGSMHKCGCDTDNVMCLLCSVVETRLNKQDVILQCRELLETVLIGWQPQMLACVNTAEVC